MEPFSLCDAKTCEINAMAAHGHCQLLCFERLPGRAARQQTCKDRCLSNDRIANQALKCVCVCVRCAPDSNNMLMHRRGRIMTTTGQHVVYQMCFMKMCDLFTLQSRYMRRVALPFYDFMKNGMAA